MIRKEILKQDWPIRLQSFTTGNQGRISEILTKLGKLAEKMSFESIEFDPNGKENTLMISLDGFGHRVKNPEEMYLEVEENGQISSLEVVDEDGQSNYLCFLS